MCVFVFGAEIQAKQAEDVLRENRIQRKRRGGRRGGKEEGGEGKKGGGIEKGANKREGYMPMIDSVRTPPPPTTPCSVVQCVQGWRCGDSARPSSPHS